MKILLSTQNPSKVDQIRPFFVGGPFDFSTLADLGITDKVVEDGTTLEQNALKKALFAHERCRGMWSIADDTGLFCHGIGDEPGIHAARWAGEDATTDEITEYTLKRLKDVADRSATFETCAVAVLPSGEIKAFLGEIDGQILEAKRCESQPNMPYSSIFLPNGSDKVWAEMTTEEENAISHRGIAFRQLREYLQTRMRP